MFLIYIFALHFLGELFKPLKLLARKPIPTFVQIAVRTVIRYVIILVGLIVANYYGWLPTFRYNSDIRVFVEAYALLAALGGGLLDMLNYGAFKLSVALRTPKHAFSRLHCREEFFHYAYLLFLYELILHNLNLIV